MFRQAAAVFVSLPTLFAPELPTTSFPLAFREMSAFASTPCSGFQGTIVATTTRHAVSNCLAILHPIVVVECFVETRRIHVGLFWLGNISSSRRSLRPSAIVVTFQRQAPPIRLGRGLAAAG